jgi:hypothetical protein
VKEKEGGGGSYEMMRTMYGTWDVEIFSSVLLYIVASLELLPWEVQFTFQSLLLQPIL